jgi:hypothetical protein
MSNLATLRPFAKNDPRINRTGKNKGHKWGLTESLVLRALVNDIKLKPKRRIAELTLGAKILKLTDDEKQPLNQIAIFQIISQLDGNIVNGGQTKAIRSGVAALASVPDNEQEETEDTVHEE